MNIWKEALALLVFLASVIAMFVMNIKVSKWHMRWVNTPQLRRIAWWGIAWFVVALTSLAWLIFGTRFLPPRFDDLEYKVSAMIIVGGIFLAVSTTSLACLWETRDR